MSIQVSSIQVTTVEAFHAAVGGSEPVPAGVTGELYAGSSRVGVGGLGYSILYASSQLQTDYLFALVLAATVLGFSFFFLVMFLEWSFLHRWHESARAPEEE